MATDGWLAQKQCLEEGGYKARRKGTVVDVASVIERIVDHFQEQNEAQKRSKLMLLLTL